MRSRRLRVLALLAVLLAVLLCVPAVQAGGKAAVVLVDGLGVDVPRPLAAEVTRREVVLDGVRGDRYSPGYDAPAILLVPGASPRGRADPRVVMLATALARAGRTVFVPELSLYAERLDSADIERLVRATAALAAASGTQGVLLGFSYGGSFALVAAADRRARPHVALVATFGSYFDLVGVVQAASTGVSVVGDRREEWPSYAPARAALREVAPVFVAEPLRPGLRAALREGDPTGLPPAARAAYELVTNDDPDRTGALARRLGPTGRAVLDTFSPAAVADRLTVPVLAGHSMDDPLVPFAELLRLEAGLPHAETMTVRSFRHVDLDVAGDRWGLVRDLVAAWSFLRRILSAQESWFD